MSHGFIVLLRASKELIFLVGVIKYNTYLFPTTWCTYTVSKLKFSYFFYSFLLPCIETFVKIFYFMSFSLINSFVVLARTIREKANQQNKLNIHIHGRRSDNRVIYCMNQSNSMQFSPKRK